MFFPATKGVVTDLHKGCASPLIGTTGPRILRGTRLNCKLSMIVQAEAPIGRDGIAVGSRNIELCIPQIREGSHANSVSCAVGRGACTVPVCMWQVMRILGMQCGGADERDLMCGRGACGPAPPALSRMTHQRWPWPAACASHLDPELHRTALPMQQRWPCH